jgi:hypothetical protein
MKYDYLQVRSEDWIEPEMKGHISCCCDCGLIHVYNFKVVNGKVKYQAIRDQRATGQVRRFDKSFPYKKEKK